MNIGGWWETVRLAGGNAPENASINGVTPEYLPLFASRIVAGRNITWADIDSGAKVAVISEDLARKLGGRNVLGRPLEFSDGRPGETPPRFEIVGIAPVMAATSMKDRPYAVWLPVDKDRPELTVVVRTLRRPQTVLPAIRQAVSEIDRNLPLVDVVTMEEQIAKGLQRERMFATLCNGFGILALVLSIVGLYGVIAYSTSRRRGEIGVRLALGAIPKDVVSMLLREGLRLVALGVAVGIVVVSLCAKYLRERVVPDETSGTCISCAGVGHSACGGIGGGRHPGPPRMRSTARGDTAAGITVSSRARIQHFAHLGQQPVRRERLVQKRSEAWLAGPPIWLSRYPDMYRIARSGFLSASRSPRSKPFIWGITTSVSTRSILCEFFSYAERAAAPLLASITSYPPFFSTAWTSFRTPSSSSTSRMVSDPLRVFGFGGGGAVTPPSRVAGKSRRWCRSLPGCRP